MMIAIVVDTAVATKLMPTPIIIASSERTQARAIVPLVPTVSTGSNVSIVSRIWHEIGGSWITSLLVTVTYTYDVRRHRI